MLYGHGLTTGCGGSWVVTGSAVPGIGSGLAGRKWDPQDMGSLKQHRALE